MKLDRVTITGADNSVRPEQLCELSREFPFVEWGILVHAQSLDYPYGESRFPTPLWTTDLRTLADQTNEMRLSLHLCGSWVRGLLLGDNNIHAPFFDGFQRVQLNFHAEWTPCNAPRFAKALEGIPGKQWIFQIDGNGGNEHMEALMGESDGVDAVALFDVSGGAGIVPATWPKPRYLNVVPGEHGEGIEVPLYHGYAGGLGPDNLEHELERIAVAAGDCRIWIDMETKVRSADDRQFDLAAVRRVLEIAERHVTR